MTRSMMIFFTLCFSHTQSVFSQGADEQYLSGVAAYMKGDYANAAGNLSLAISRNNSEARIYIIRGASLLELNESAKAIEDFTEANLIEPDIADLWLARAYAAENNDKLALEFLKDHLSSPAHLPEDSIKKDPAFDRLQLTPGWDDIWQNEWYSASEKVISESGFYVKKKQFDRAIALLDDEIGKNPDDLKLLEARGSVFLKQGNYAAAAGDFSSVINRNKLCFSCYSQRGMAYLQMQRFKEAANDFTRSIKNNPAEFMMYPMRARAFAGSKDWQSAIRDMQIYLRYFENDQHAVHLCGQFYFEDGDYINALKYFNRNLTEDPTNALYYKDRGKTYIQTSTFRYAVGDLSMSLDLDPNDAESWLYLGIAKIKSGHPADGCSDLKKARELGNTEAVKYIVDLCGD